LAIVPHSGLEVCDLRQQEMAMATAAGHRSRSWPSWVTMWIRSSSTSTPVVTGTGSLSCQRLPAPLAASSRLRAG